MSPKALQSDINHEAGPQLVTMGRKGSLGRGGVTRVGAGQTSVWNASGNNFTEIKKKKTRAIFEDGVR
jgi:hypothetical protein